MVKQTQPDRRKFISQLAMLGVAAPLSPGIFNKLSPVPFARKTGEARIDAICVFSKHLNFLDYDKMAVLVKEMGFDGIDLTVRPEGHVLPENVERDLPKAVEAAKKAGVTIPTITTSITNVNDPYAEKILATASKLGIKHYRMGWLEYDMNRNLVDGLIGLVPSFKALAALNKKYGIIGDYQNHSGIHIGAPVWDILRVLEFNDGEWVGCQYDIRHATVEGGNCWPLGFRVIQPYIHTLVIKDCYWKKNEDKWTLADTPVGEGMVDFKSYFDLLKTTGTRATVTVHFEYPLTNQPDSLLPVPDKLDQVKIKMKKDLETIRRMITEASIAY
jgi:L-ribulose-5-phosphate 3-epimerase